MRGKADSHSGERLLSLVRGLRSRFPFGALSAAGEAVLLLALASAWDGVVDLLPMRLLDAEGGVLDQNALAREIGTGPAYPDGVVEGVRAWRVGGREYLVHTLPLTAGRWLEVWVGPAGSGFAEELFRRLEELLSRGGSGNVYRTALDLLKESVPAAEGARVLVLESGELLPAASWGVVGQAAVSRLWVPVSIRGRVGLALELFSTRPGAFGEEERRLVRWVALLLGLVLEWRKSVREVERTAYYDPVTGLPNERFWSEVGGEVFAKLISGTSVAVLSVGVKRPRELEHPESDLVLAEVARRLKAALSPSDLLVRVAGEELAALLPGRGHREVEELVSRLHAAGREPVRIGEREFSVSLTVGAAIADRGEAVGLGELWSRARQAMFRAESEGQPLCFHDPQREGKRRAEAELLAALRKDLAQGRLELYVQPIWDLDSESYYAMEVLLRWRESPSRFIPLAERKGLGPELDQYVLSRANELASAIGRLLWVNLLPSTLAQPDLPQRVAELADPSRVAIEVTEYALLQPRAKENIARLKELGFRLALDDFGSGYASLSLLTELPVEVLKLDRSVVIHLEQPKVRALVKGIAAIARDLGLDLLAEGIEDRSVLDSLRGYGFRYAQGYAVARPAPGASFVVH